MYYDTNITSAEQMNCCGISEIDDLGAARNAAEAMYSILDEWNIARFVIFSQAGKTAKYGVNFARYIKKHKLGTVIETPGWKVNPNSNNLLKVWIWTIDTKACEKWYQREDKKQNALINSDYCGN